MITKAGLPISLTILIITAPALVFAGDIISALPEQAAADTRYVFYLHGQIVQELGQRPTHPRYGLYDYPLILEALAADGIVSLPKLKTHGMVRVTGAVKNQFGCIPGLLKGEFHARMPDVDLFGQLLVDLNLYLRPRLFVMDGIIAMEGNGPRRTGRNGHADPAGRRSY